MELKLNFLQWDSYIIMCHVVFNYIRWLQHNPICRNVAVVVVASVVVVIGWKITSIRMKSLTL